MPGKVWYGMVSARQDGMAGGELKLICEALNSDGVFTLRLEPLVYD